MARGTTGVTSRHTTAPLATQPRYATTQLRAGFQESRSPGDAAAAVTASVKPASIWRTYFPTWAMLEAADSAASAGPHGKHRSLPLRPEIQRLSFRVRSATKSLGRQPQEARVGELWHHQGGTLDALPNVVDADDVP